MMKKSELMNGDFVVTRSGWVGLVILNKPDDGYIVLDEHCGWEDLYNFDDDMVYAYDEDAIMQVYRGPRGFNELVEDSPFFDRDETWIGPIEIAYHQRIVEAEKREAERAAQQKSSDNGLIYIVAQGFYGNRTGTEIRRDGVDYFLKGNPSRELFPDAEKTVDRRIMKVPGSGSVVIVYDQNQEDEYLNVKFPEMLAEDGAEYFANTGREMKPWVSCSIPELDVELHTRCFACRIDENGEFQSLEDDDDDAFIKYFPEK